jgi:hypothetical protein
MNDMMTHWIIRLSTYHEDAHQVNVRLKVALRHLLDYMNIHPECIEITPTNQINPVSFRKRKGIEQGDGNQNQSETGGARPAG